jgi:2-polyprenyl-3-methyl-5-hydroxy-6-metoxy-1,4-benzoquinol methylase
MINFLRTLFHKVSNAYLEQQLTPKVEQLQRKVEHLQQLVLEQQYRIDPQAFGNPVVFKELTREKELTLPDEAALIHKNDLMFRYLLHIHMDTRLAYHHYYQSGYIIVEEILKFLPKDVKRGAYLDMASGHGRVTRFMKGLFDDITVSDIKAEAVAFQQQQFGFHGYPSTFKPEEFTPGRTFDVITVISMFTHLDEDLFRRWFAVLAALLNPGGVLLLTTHGQKIDPSVTPERPVSYTESSEDQLFWYVSDAISDATKYGTSAVHPDFVLKLAAAHHLQAEFHPYAMNSIQDAWVLRKRA